MYPRACMHGRMYVGLVLIGASGGVSVSLRAWRMHLCGLSSIAVVNWIVIFIFDCDHFLYSRVVLYSLMQQLPLAALILVMW